MLYLHPTLGVFVTSSLGNPSRILNSKNTQVYVFHLILSNLFVLDPSKDIKRQRKVEPRNPDPFVVPKLPVEWMSKKNISILFNLLTVNLAYVKGSLFLMQSYMLAGL